MAALKMLEIGRLGSREAAARRASGSRISWRRPRVTGRRNQHSHRQCRHRPAVEAATVRVTPRWFECPRQLESSGWRRALGVFAADPLMRQIVESGRRVT